MAGPSRSTSTKASVGIPLTSGDEPVLLEKLAIVHAHHHIRLVPQIHLDNDRLQESCRIHDDSVLFILGEIDCMVEQVI